MDEIDHRLIDAWDKVCERIKRDPEFAAARRRMLERKIVTQPMRDWCVALRASDTRISDFHFIITYRDDWEKKMAHRVQLCGESLQLLLKPVANPWPGMRQRDAADKLGVCFEVVGQWIKKGLVQARWEHPGGDNYFGKPSPWVWWDGVRDPQHKDGKTPDAVWGSLWQYLWKRVPADWTQEVWRVPRERLDPRYGVVFSGWNWRCPGTVDVNGKWQPCGKLVRWLYAALPPLRVQDFLGERSPLDLPRLPDGPHAFRMACMDCTGWDTLKHGKKDPMFWWNQFVRHVSGGLLLGSDVEYPFGAGEWGKSQRKLTGSE
ncbi:MAG: hypothetical protein WD768_03690 [Phycisphaeraceae bacterium]